MQAYQSDNDLKASGSAAAHLIHGSSENRFTVTYAPGKISREEIEKVNFKYMDINEAIRKYNPRKLNDGFNTMPNGEEIFYISAPAMGLWIYKSKLEGE